MKTAIILTSEEDLRKYIFNKLLDSGHEDADWIISNCKACIVIGDLNNPELVEFYNPNPILGQTPYFSTKELIPE